MKLKFVRAIKDFESVSGPVIYGTVFAAELILELPYPKDRGKYDAEKWNKEYLNYYERIEIEAKACV